MIKKEDLIEILTILLELDFDKNFNLSDLERYKYSKLLRKVKGD